MCRSIEEKSAAKVADDGSVSNFSGNLPQTSNELEHQQVETAASVSYKKSSKKRLYIELLQISTSYPGTLDKQGHIEPTPYQPSKKQRIEKEITQLDENLMEISEVGVNLKHSNSFQQWKMTLFRQCVNSISEYELSNKIEPEFGRLSIS